ncbi:DUF4214 domain-containing protein [uncultured Pseudomonas sp.]|uniref:DUF4214 domain-containing protein n=1 Tax=uncultured Pseudomonas sp. TaxID=114707 RepID=UPI00258E9D14|nr:DUF4214 domain-containing protein [uncultured Pseudomonas sp.]
MAVTSTQVQSLYLAYFGRPAEQAGLTYWTSQANATVDQVSAAFAQQPEYTSVYGGLTRAQVVDTLYQNLFGRTAANNELTYWINSADVSVDRLALALVNGATGTDRLLLDSKTQFASTVTANAGTAGTVAGVKSDFGTVTNTGATAAQYTAANTAAKAAVTPSITDSTASATLNFKGLSAGTVTFADLSNSTAAALTLAGTNVATSLTLQGTVDGNAAITLNEAPTAPATDVVTSLNLNVSSSATTGTPVLTVNAQSSATNALSALTTIDGSSSTAGLSITTTSLDALSKVTTGSGNDTVVVDTINTTDATKAVALTVDTGAGNDTITGTVGTAALTITAGAGNDTITVSAGSANLVVNAGAGNDTVTLGATGTVASTVTASHTSVITLGDGNDVVNFSAAVANIQNYTATTSTSTAAQVTAADTALKAGLISISDFNVSADQLNFTVATGGAAGSNSVATLTNAQIGAISAATSLSSAVQLAASDLGGKAAVAFQYGSDTYVFVDAAGAGTVDSGDALIQLTGVTATQLTAANFTHA